MVSFSDSEVISANVVCGATSGNVVVELHHFHHDVHLVVVGISKIYIFDPIICTINGEYDHLSDVQFYSIQDISLWDKYITQGLISERIINSGNVLFISAGTIHASVNINDVDSDFYKYVIKLKK